MRIRPRCKDVAPFLAGSRPGRLHKRRKREHDERRLQWLAWRVEGLDSSVAMGTLRSAGCPTTRTAQTPIIVHETAHAEMVS